MRPAAELTPGIPCFFLQRQSPSRDPNTRHRSLMQLPADAAKRDGNRKYKTVRSIFALIVREMSTTYGKSPGGYFWAIAEPVLGIALLSVVFSLALRSPPIGGNFQIFYATGFMPFIFYREIEAKTQSCVRFSQRLLFYPTLTYADSFIARLFLTMITQLLVFYLVIGGILLLWETRTSIVPLYVISSLSAALVLGAGIGVVNCVLTAYAPVWSRVWVVLNRPLVIISGVIFLHDSVPEPWRGYLWWNPLIHIVGQMRRGFYPQYQGEYVYMLYPFGLGLVLLVIGLTLLNRYNRDIVNLL